MHIARAIFALLVCSVVGSANSIIVQVDTPLGESIYINQDGVATQLGWAGGITGAADGHSRLLWCLQLFVDINTGTTYNSVVDWADTANLQRVGWMVQNVAPTLTTKAQGAAFQLAIWDIMEDNGDGLTSGRVAKSSSSVHPTDATVLSLAAQYETQSVGKNFKWVPVYHNFTVNGGAAVQNLIGGLTYDGGVDGMAPEPGGLWMVLGGAALILLPRVVRYFRRGSPPRSPSPSTIR
jgi:hypothetical protein